jgi:hypothetical protein
MKKEIDEYGELILSVEDTRKRVLSDLLDMRRHDSTSITSSAIAIYIRTLQAAEAPDKDGRLPSTKEIGERLESEAAIHRRVHDALRTVAARYQYEVVKEWRKS